MLEYCRQDVRVTEKTLSFLEKALDPFGGTSVDLEHGVQHEIHKQMSNGWLLNQRQAFDLIAGLKEKQNELEDKVHETFKPLPTFVKEVQPKYKKNGLFLFFSITLIASSV